MEEPTSTTMTESIKLHHATPELLRSVINGLKKPALKSWASSCSIQHSNNPVTNKSRLCQLLDLCLSTGSEETVSLLTLLTKKLDDRAIKLESLANGLSLSSTAAQRKADLVQWYSEKFPRKIKVKLDSPLIEQNSEEESSVPPTPVNVTAQLNHNLKSGAKRNKKHRKKTKRCSELSVLISDEPTMISGTGNNTLSNEQSEEKTIPSLSSVVDKESKKPVLVTHAVKGENESEAAQSQPTRTKTESLFAEPQFSAHITRQFSGAQRRTPATEGHYRSHSQFSHYL